MEQDEIKHLKLRYHNLKMKHRMCCLVGDMKQEKETWAAMQDISRHIGKTILQEA